MRIGDVAKATDTAIGTIRYYEREGLLARPARSCGNFRIYTGSSIERLLFIRRCRSLDVSLAEIRTLLFLKDNPAEDCGDVNTLLDTHIAGVGARMRELRTLQRHLKRLRNLCEEVRDAAHCAILKDLSIPSVRR